LKGDTAFKAWGSPAGMMIVWPVFTVCGFPEIRISTSPSITCTMASKGAVCSLNPCPWSKAMVPVFLSMMVLLTTASFW
jgi:hypothetical protein